MTDLSSRLSRCSCGTDDCRNPACDTIREAAGVLQAIAALHTNIERCESQFDPYDTFDNYCLHDGHEWPCPTARLLQGEGDRG